jgi:hypothetical protein
MTYSLRVLSSFWVTVLLLLIMAGPACAGDCTSRDDCTQVPDNGSKATVVVSIFAGAGLAWRNRKNGQNGREGE